MLNENSSVSSSNKNISEITAGIYQTLLDISQQNFFISNLLNNLQKPDNLRTIDENPNTFINYLKCESCDWKLTDNSKLLTREVPLLNIDLKEDTNKTNLMPDQQYICSYCNKSYKCKENLTLHTLNIHMDVKPYSCRFCNKKFSHRNGKAYHEKHKH